MEDKSRLVLAAALVAGALAATASLGAGEETEVARAPVQERRFVHLQGKQGNHVSRQWLERQGADFKHEETARDCQGCHQWQAPSAVGESEVHADLTLVCKACHTEGLIQAEVAAGFERLGNLQRMDQSFLHGDHKGLSCRDCHAPEPSDDPTAQGEAPILPIRRGANYCAECHDDAPAPERKQGMDRFSAGKLVQGFRDRLNAGAAARSKAQAGFVHSDHLLDPASSGTLAVELKAEQGSCVECHQSLVQAPTPGSAPCFSAKFAVESCADCHIGRGGPVGIEVAQGQGVSLAKDTFRHQDHLGFVGNRSAEISADGHRRIEEKSCSLCHEVAPPMADASMEDCYQYRSLDGHAVHSYEGCATCHEDWTGDRPHGGWDRDADGHRCTECHQFPGTSMEDERAMVTTQRAREVQFSFTRNAHPFISTNRAGELQSCEECHVATVKDLPSRITDAWSRFDHGVHLGSMEELGAAGYDAQCKTCHTEALVGSTASSALLGTAAQAADGLARSYSLDSCGQCHQGEAKVVETVPASLAAGEGRRHHNFPHSRHVGQNWKDEEMGCSTCHEVDQDTAFSDVGVVATHLDCTACHGHDDDEPAKVKASAGVTQSQVEHCATCHAQSFPSADEAEVMVLGDDMMLTALGGAQLHSPPGMSCADCHLEPTDEKLGPPIFGVLVDSARRKDAKTLHAIAPRPRDCMGCHWGNLGEPNESEYYTGSPPRKRPDANTLRGYPGTGS